VRASSADGSDLPLGTVTFLYTDIEGSTTRWERWPDAMKAAVERHDAILRQAIASAGGRVFRTMGDAFCASFPTAPEAAAAVDAQRALRAEVWPVPEPIRVRMAVHSGVGEVRDADYVGPALNRIARLLATGHGGQVLLSEPAFDLVRDTLPAGVTVRDLGEHRLKDLLRPEHVYQLAIEGLPSDFPPLVSLAAYPNNLPVQVTSFIGRERELAAIDRRLATARLLTLTGPGGAGKTRLALHAAADVLETFSNGAWLAELAPISDPAQVPAGVAAALRVREQSGERSLDTLIEALRSRRLLLILDNCEHVIDACARLAEAILRASSTVTIIATSREALNIPGETLVPVPSLELPEPGATLTPDQLAGYEAIRLFIERASAVIPGFAITEENADDVLRICRRLDGIPLALELAAARLRSLTVAEVAQRLDDRFRLLVGGGRTAMPRQQTLRALIDWSYELLTEPERTVLRRLSVFVGPWVLDAAEAVCADGDIRRDEVLDHVAHLVDKSLLEAREAGRTTRYRMLDSVREYAREKLLDAGEALAIRRRHFDHFLAVAERVTWDPQARSSSAGDPRIDRDYDDVIAALRWIQQEPDAAESELRLAAAMLGPASFAGRTAEPRRVIEHALARGDPYAHSLVRARGLLAAAALAGMQGDFDAAGRRAHESVEMLRALGERRELAMALMTLGRSIGRADAEAARAAGAESRALFEALGERWGLGMANFLEGDGALERGDYAAARVRLTESVDHFRATGDQDMSSSGLLGLGRIACVEGDPSRGRALAEEALELRRHERSPSKWRIAIALNSLAEILRCAGRPADARPYVEEALPMYREIDDDAGVAWSLHNLAHLALAAGDHGRARAEFNESLSVRARSGSGAELAASLAGLAAVAVREGRLEEAARLHGAAADLLARGHLVLAPADEEIRAGDLETLRSRLGRRFDALIEEGRAVDARALIAEIVAPARGS